MKTSADPEISAIERAERYYAAHPGSPSTLQRPKIFNRSGTWVALLGPTIEKGIVGFGLTVEAALRAFDVRYQGVMRPVNDEER